jgi:predicted dehydrogenase
MKKLSILLLLAVATASAWGQQNTAPVRLAIVGLVHDHVRGFLPELPRHPEVQLVGVVEPNKELAEQVATQFHLDPKLFFPSIDALHAATKVDAVATFTSTFDHRAVVEACAPLGIHVMMEKPMAVSLADAQAMAAAARKGGIQVVVNYETTWYPSTQSAYDMVHRQHAVGDLRKIVVHDGHEGPAHFVSPYFMAWLGDPVLDGGGAVMDFGCYGADLVTWLMEGERPKSVLAVLQNFQPEAYPKVDDEATIVLTYPRAQAILQASWNWPAGRKDMEIYGQTGALRLPDRNSLFLRQGYAPETTAPAPALTAPYGDPISYFAAVVRGQIQPSGLSSVYVNLIVCEILDAAKESARTGRRIDLGNAAIK